MYAFSVLVPALLAMDAVLSAVLSAPVGAIACIIFVVFLLPSQEHHAVNQIGAIVANTAATFLTKTLPLGGITQAIHALAIVGTFKSKVPESPAKFAATAAVIVFSLALNHHVFVMCAPSLALLHILPARLVSALLENLKRQLARGLGKPAQVDPSTQTDFPYPQQLPEVKQATETSPKASSTTDLVKYTLSPNMRDLLRTSQKCTTPPKPFIRTRPAPELQSEPEPERISTEPVPEPETEPKQFVSEPELEAERIETPIEPEMGPVSPFPIYKAGEHIYQPIAEEVSKPEMEIVRIQRFSERTIPIAKPKAKATRINRVCKPSSKIINKAPERGKPLPEPKTKTRSKNPNPIPVAKTDILSARSVPEPESQPETIQPSAPIYIQPKAFTLAESDNPEPTQPKQHTIELAHTESKSTEPLQLSKSSELSNETSESAEPSEVSFKPTDSHCYRSVETMIPDEDDAVANGLHEDNIEEAEYGPLTLDEDLQMMELANLFGALKLTEPPLFSNIAPKPFDFNFHNYMMEQEPDTTTNSWQIMDDFMQSNAGADIDEPMQDSDTALPNNEVQAGTDMKPWSNEELERLIAESDFTLYNIPSDNSGFDPSSNSEPLVENEDQMDTSNAGSGTNPGTNLNSEDPANDGYTDDFPWLHLNNIMMDEGFGDARNQTAAAEEVSGGMEVDPPPQLTRTPFFSPPAAPTTARFTFTGPAPSAAPVPSIFGSSTAPTAVEPLSLAAFEPTPAPTGPAPVRVQAPTGAFSAASPFTFTPEPSAPALVSQAPAAAPVPSIFSAAPAPARAALLPTHTPTLSTAPVPVVSPPAADPPAADPPAADPPATDPPSSAPSPAPVSVSTPTLDLFGPTPAPSIPVPAAAPEPEPMGIAPPTPTPTPTPTPASRPLLASTLITMDRVTSDDWAPPLSAINPAFIVPTKKEQEEKKAEEKKKSEEKKETEKKEKEEVEKEKKAETKQEGEGKEEKKTMKKKLPPPKPKKAPSCFIQPKRKPPQKR